MRLNHLHSWDLSPKQAIAIQQQLAKNIITYDCLNSIEMIAGVDVGFENAGTITRAAVHILQYPTLEPVQQSIARRKTTFPYIPGFIIVS